MRSQRKNSEVWMDPKCRGFCSHGVGVHHPPVFGCIHQPGSSLKPIQLGFLWRFYHRGMAGFYFQLLSLVLSLVGQRVGRLKVPSF